MCDEITCNIQSESKFIKIKRRIPASADYKPFGGPLAVICFDDQLGNMKKI